MSDISPISRPTSTALNGSARASQASVAATTATRRGDQVEFSSQAKFLSKLKALPDVRDELINSVRAQIEAGQYETEERMDTAINALLDDLS